MKKTTKRDHAKKEDTLVSWNRKSIFHREYLSVLSAHADNFESNFPFRFCAFHSNACPEYKWLRQAIEEDVQSDCMFVVHVLGLHNTLVST